jgi:cell division protein FtsQ
MKKLLKILFIIPVLYLIVIPVYMASSTGAKPCGGIVVDISDSSEYHFVTKRQLLNLAYGNSGRIAGKPVKEISTSAIESRLDVLKELKKAEVYTTIDGMVHIYVEQRNPIMRVIPDGGGDFFVDEEGIVVRRRNLYNPRLHIVEGNVTISSSMLNGVSILDSAIKHSILKDIYPLVNYINDDKFWSAQIDQIYIDGNDEIDLIPRAGYNQIHLGTVENYKGKLRNLEAFYDKVLPEVGWNKYSVINLEFKDQIVCKRRENQK